MDIELSPQLIEAREGFRHFVEEMVVPYADRYDREERTPTELVTQMAANGYLGTLIPKEYGGQGADMMTHGLLCEEIGRGSASLCSLITVHGMVSQAIQKWGSQEQQRQWLPKLASGEVIAAFGLSEPSVGSDAKSVETTAVAENGEYVLNGTKRWISFGQVADLVLIVAQCEGKPTAFLVETDRQGFSAKPITDMLGFRSAMLAELCLEDCRIPQEHLLGRVGFGFSHVAGSALDYGRFCVAWGCVGMGEACLDACLRYTKKRKQFGSALRKHQLIQAMIAEMITNLKAARLLCYQSARAKDQGDFGSIMDTSIAKYFASKMVNQAASDAVQIHGANGCSGDYPVQRYMRDARVMEIIEGSTQMQQIIIAHYGYQMLL
jgi:alkylation response protein AidB-like acyl-CoA dehydrogenase